MPAARGMYGLSCWNALSPEQQDRLRNVGVLQIGYRPEGTECDRGAEIGIERPYEGDEKPGPRFYCLSCALNYLTELWEEKLRAEGWTVYHGSGMDDMNMPNPTETWTAKGGVQWRKVDGLWFWKAPA